MKVGTNHFSCKFHIDYPDILIRYIKSWDKQTKSSLEAGTPFKDFLTLDFDFNTIPIDFYIIMTNSKVLKIMRLAETFLPDLQIARNSFNFLHL